MIITDLELNNFRKHRKLRLKFKEGVTGIVGDNGTGKSSIIEALLFALTGSLFNGTKDDAISLGEDTGDVKITFILNGKKGVLQRWLSGSKVQLSYDGAIPLKKAGEVKELWDKLLQVGPEIISKVIIAQQGNIPLLFSGDSSIREKIFQKIFLVPNTEKVRSTISKNYLKQLPPLLPIEDIEDLRNEIHNIKKEIEGLKEEIKQLPLLDDLTVEEFKEQLRFLYKCESDAGSRIIVSKAINDSEDRISVLLEERSEYVEVLKSINISDYEKQKNTLLQHKALFQQKISLKNSLDKLLSVEVDVDHINHLKQDIIKLKAEEKELYTKSIALKVKIDANTLQASKFKDLKDKAVCNTCGQPLHSITDLLNLLEQERKELVDEYNEVVVKLRITEEAIQHEQTGIDNGEKHIANIVKIQESLSQFKDIEFNENDLTSFIEVIETYREYEKALSDVKIRIASEESQLSKFKTELSNLAEYVGNDIHKDKASLAQALNQQVENTRAVQTTQTTLQMKEYTLQDLEGRLVRSRENQEKNKKRNRYSELLNIANDVLQTSNFPRKLILNYADVVSEYLQEKLQDFNMPYTAKVADNFKIEMFDEDGRRLPSVSGGQEIQVGIALHLALHELFSQSFPLMIIDEGTTHLDTTNRKAYFDIIKKLKSADKLQQIIIIDHDPMLSEVVDHVISLGEEIENE